MMKMKTENLPITLETKSRQQNRYEMEKFIQRTFNLAWGAHVTSFMPTLLGVRDTANQLKGVLGLRPAEKETLFLEQYLEHPVESLLGKHFSEPVYRDEIIEVGNLAVSERGGGHWLIIAMTAFLYMSGKKWVVFTAGSVLKNGFLKMGLQPVELGIATPDRLINKNEDWGRYYDQKPMVLGGKVATGFNQLNKILTAETALHALWQNAGIAGQHYK